MFINRVEFVVTRACTGRCKHCSLGVSEALGIGESEQSNEHIQYDKLAGLITKLKSKLPIESVMCFGGEPLLHAEEVSAILREAKEAGVHKRELITNGFFSRDPARIIAVAERLNEFDTGIGLSVDAFHQETIPLEPLQIFAKHARNLVLHPAWLVSPEDDNPWNVRTREILAQFGGLPVSNGNVIFFGGNARKYLSEYFTEDSRQVSEYIGQPSLCIVPNGDVFGPDGKLGNAYRDDILEKICGK